MDQSEASESFENGIISSKVLYDRLEDQNLQLASQIQKHQEELDAYFSKMAAEADKECFFIFRYQVKHSMKRRTPVRSIEFASF